MTTLSEIAALPIPPFRANIRHVSRKERAAWVEGQYISDKLAKARRFTKGYWKIADAIWKAIDRGYRPAYYEAQAAEWAKFKAEQEAEMNAPVEDDPPAPTPDPLPEPSAPALPEVCAAQVPSLAPYFASIQFWGAFPWGPPRDDTAAATLREYGYRQEVKTGRMYGPPYLARRLPVRPCHSLPEVSYRPYA